MTADLVEKLTAERDALHDALTRLVRYLSKHGGYMSAENQAALRGAKALLAEIQPAHDKDGNVIRKQPTKEK